MKIAIVVAVAENGAIGRGGDLLWKLPADMQHFKRITIGHHVVMGRKTYESIPPKFRPLPERINIIVTRQKHFKAEGCQVVSTIEEAIQFAEDSGEEELMIIGGGEIYKQVFDRTNRIYLTTVKHRFEDADTFFPEIKNEEWKELSAEEHAADDKHAYAYEFKELKRR
ncbi:MAG: dihydrofolate reductase [Chitinophagales bacterium]